MNIRKRKKTSLLNNLHSQNVQPPTTPSGRFNDCIQCWGGGGGEDMESNMATCEIIAKISAPIEYRCKISVAGLLA